MIEVLIKCDSCKKPAKSYRYSDGCSMDASGNGYNEDWVYKDFCFDCLVNFINETKIKTIKEYHHRHPDLNNY